jgi:hypothetical protein
MFRLCLGLSNYASVFRAKRTKFNLTLSRMEPFVSLIYVSDLIEKVLTLANTTIPPLYAMKPPTFAKAVKPHLLTY